MMQPLPKIIPINELKNTAKITETCKNSDVPIVVTKNGYAEMVMMSIDLYEKIVSGSDTVSSPECAAGCAATDKRGQKTDDLS